MKTAIFILPFDPITRQTGLPQLEEGQTISWVHLEPEVGSTVKVQVTADEAIIEVMKADPVNEWVEDL
jgi:hypothetical protein